MHEATVNEFPFVAELPKREKSKLAKVWDSLERVRAITDVNGSILPQSFVAKLLDLSTQRISQLVAAGSLESVDLDGRLYVTEKSVIEWARNEHKAGRPSKPEELAEMGVMARAKYCYKASREWVSEHKAKK